jgi:hypothetical protein
LKQVYPEKTGNSSLPMVNNPRWLRVSLGFPGLECYSSVQFAKRNANKARLRYPQVTPSHFLLFIPWLTKGAIVLTEKSWSSHWNAARKEVGSLRLPTSTAGT